MYLELTNMNLLIEGRREDILNRFNENPELQRTVEEFLDHEFNNRTNYKYVNWVLKRNFDNMGNQMAPFDEIIPYLERFDKVRKNLTKKDINQYISIGQLYNTIDQYGDTRSEERTKVKEGTEKIFESNEVLVVKPLTQESSCYYGSGTRWCTAASVNNRFKQYSRLGVLYYLIFKNIEKDNDYYKIAIHYDSKDNRMTLYDAKDRVNDNLLGFIKNSPAFKSIEKDIEKSGLYVPKKNVEDELKDLFSNLHLMDFEKKYRRVIDGKPLYILPKSENLDGKIYAQYGNREVVLTVEGNEIVFYALDTNIVDRNSIEEVLGYIGDEYGGTVTVEKIKSSPIRIIFDILKPYILQNKEELSVGNDDIIYWSPKNIHSSYSFENRNPNNAYIQFLNYIKTKQKNGEPADKRDFLINVLGKDPDKVDFAGYFSTMFGTLSAAGLVTIYRAKERPYFRYKLGPNYKAWTEGRLKRI